MDFEILMEGTMIGAELQALAEADLTSAKNATNAGDFAATIVAAFEADAKELQNRAKAAKAAARENVNLLKEHQDEIIEYVKQSNDERAIRSVIEGDANISPEAQVLMIKAQLSTAVDLTNAIIVGAGDILKEIKQVSKSIKPKLAKTFEAANKSAGSKLGDAITEKAKSTGEVALNDSKALIKRLSQAFKLKVKFTKEYSNWVSKFLAKYKLTRPIADFFATLKMDIIGVDIALMQYDIFRKRFNGAIKDLKIAKIAKLNKLPEVTKDASSSIGAPAKEIEKAEQQSEGALTKLNKKIGDLLNKIAAKINDPSVGTVAVTVAVAMATYLALYGFVKSAGGQVSSVVNVPGTIKAAAILIKEGSWGKKFVTIALLAVVTTAFAVAGKTGYNFIKKKLAAK